MQTAPCKPNASDRPKNLKKLPWTKAACQVESGYICNNKAAMKENDDINNENLQGFVIAATIRFIEDIFWRIMRRHLEILRLRSWQHWKTRNDFF